jgi:ABC-type dipeptide/oligopeptide/nickel transport system permease component
MLRHALRRLLWTLPTLVGISVIAFLVLSFVPDPTDDPTLRARLHPAELSHLRRQRALDLPRFVNVAPRDVRQRAAQAMAALADGSDRADAARAELVRLGGAALPHVLPALDALAPDPRARVAAALGPVAVRMGLRRAEDAGDPATAVPFWTRFWDDRGVEFRAAAVRSAVQRLARYGTATRVAELIELDTFALDDVIAALEPPYDVASGERARVLLDIAAHVTGSADRIAPDASLAEAGACVQRWRHWWTIYRSDFVVLAGPARGAAMLTETRYGKWALTAVTQRLGVDNQGRPVASELARRVPVTVALVFGAIVLAYALGIPLGVLSAASRGRKTDLLIATSVLVCYAVPTAVLAVLVAGRGAHGLFAGMVVLAVGLVAVPTRQQRSAVAWAMSQDWVRAALARGNSRPRALLVHALRNGLLPVLTLAALEPPMALGGAFVIEHVLGLPGVGDPTIAAVHGRDVAWLMAVALVAGAFAALGVIVADLAYVLADPRLARPIFSRKRSA